MNIGSILEKIYVISDDIERTQMDIEAERRVFLRREENLNLKIQKLQENKEDCFTEITNYASQADLTPINVRIILKYLRYFSTNQQISERLFSDELYLFSAPTALRSDKYITQIISLEYQKIEDNNFRSQLFQALTPINFSYFDEKSNLSLQTCAPIAHIKNCDFDFIVKIDSFIYKMSLLKDGDLKLGEKVQF